MKNRILIGILIVGLIVIAGCVTEQDDTLILSSCGDLKLIIEDTYCNFNCNGMKPCDPTGEQLCLISECDKGEYVTGRALNILNLKNCTYNKTELLEKQQKRYEERCMSKPLWWRIIN